MNEFSEYKDSASRIVKVAIDNMKLRLTDSLVQVLAGVAIGAIAIIVVAIAIFFFSAGVAFELSEEMDPIWAFAIVGGFYLLLFAIIFACRKRLIYDRLARMLSKIILKNPNNTNDEENGTEYYKEETESTADSGADSSPSAEN